MRPDSIEVMIALERQRRALERLSQRLRVAQRTLLPGPSAQWQGQARRSFDAAVHLLGALLESTAVLIDETAAHTEQARRQVQHHG